MNLASKARESITYNGPTGSPVAASVARETSGVNISNEISRASLLRRGFALEYATLGWNVGRHRRVGYGRVGGPLGGAGRVGLDSLIEIGTSTVVIWELSGTGEKRQHRALRLIGGAFALLAVYLAVQSTVVLAAGYRPHHSVLGIVWTAVTASVMLCLAAGKARTSAALDNPVL